MKLQTLKSSLQRLPSKATVLKGEGWRAGKTTTERGYGYRWQQARLRHLAAHPLCAMCEAENKTVVATVVDHRIPHRGDQALFWNESNWQSLCATHHSGEKQRQERAYQ